MLYTASDTCRILTYPELCLFRYIQAYSTYSALFKHFHTYWGILKAYSGLFRHIQQPCNPCIFRTLPYFGPWQLETDTFKTLWNFDQAYSGPCLRTVYPSIQLHSWLSATLPYTETWYIHNPGVFGTFP